MKICIAAPWIGSSDISFMNIADRIASTLRGLGHDVVAYPWVSYGTPGGMFDLLLVTMRAVDDPIFDMNKIRSVRCKKRVCYSLAPDSTLVTKAEARNYNALFSFVITCSEFCRKSLVNSGVFIPVHVVPLGFDPALYVEKPRDFQETPLRLIYVGRNWDHKDQRLLYDVMDRVREPMHLVIKGSALRPHPKVTHVTNDRMSYRDVAELYQQAHLGIAISHGEGFGLPGLEALATGIPIVASRFGGILDFANDANSFLLRGQEVDAKGMFAAGQWMQHDSQHVAAMLDHISLIWSQLSFRARNARPSVDHLTWDNTARELIKICRPD